jgi:lysozyme
MPKQLYGIDASNYQGQIAWRNVRHGGYTFGAELATDGLSFRSPLFPSQWKALIRAMPVRFAYHYLRISESGSSQADAFHAYVKSSGGMHDNCAILLDCEDMDTAYKLQAPEVIDDFLTRALAKIQRQVCIYMGQYYFDFIGRPSIPLMLQRPLWVPAWQENPPPVIQGWPVLSFWQNSDTSLVPGVVGPVDHDVFFGTYEQLVKVVKYP